VESPPAWQRARPILITATSARHAGLCQFLQWPQRIRAASGNCAHRRRRAWHRGRTIQSGPDA
jgi:hypothetical protein